jgi:glycosyltransferase involved in cell wall biosynthesis
MSCGIPCLSFDCDYGPREIIKDGVTGLLVENGNHVKLAEGMLWMINHPSERILMGEKARESVKRYQTDYIMQQWIELFNLL